MTSEDQRTEDVPSLLSEQVAFYRAVASEYEDHAIAGEEEAADLSAVVDAFAPTGRVLELACGPGSWTGQLLRHASAMRSNEPAVRTTDSISLRGDRAARLLARAARVRLAA